MSISEQPWTALWNYSLSHLNPSVKVGILKIEEGATEQLLNMVKRIGDPLKPRGSCQVRDIISQEIYCRYNNSMIALREIQKGGALWKSLKVFTVGRSITSFIQKKHSKNLPVRPFQVLRPIWRTRVGLHNPWWDSFIPDWNQSGNQAANQKDSVLPTDLLLQLRHRKPRFQFPKPLWHPDAEEILSSPRPHPLEHFGKGSRGWNHLPDHQTQERLILELMARGGMRIGEVLKLTPKDIEDRKLTLRAPKSGEEREIVFIPQKIADRLKEYITKKGIGADQRIFPIS